jgi:RNA ligase
VATRGSFTSDQALHATKVLNERYRGFLAAQRGTYLVEIIYPENRIVVDYKGRDDLVLLDILDTEDGDSLLDAAALYWPRATLPFPKAEQFTVNDVMRDRPNAEGYVITNVVTGERVKVKFEEYKRLHKLLTGVSSKTVWEILSKGESVDTLLDTVPDEFYDFVNKTAASLLAEFDRIFIFAWQVFRNVVKMFPGDRKGFAQFVQESEYKDLYFGLLDDKDISPMIWKRLKPTYAKPFWNVDEATS